MSRVRVRFAAVAALLGGLIVWGAGSTKPAVAIPLFAHQYGVSCDKCHSVIPHLNAFGTAFMASGYRIPGVKPGPAFPISSKANLVDSSENQGSGPNGAGLPKAIVDEIELFTAGAIGSRASYLVEQYAIDGGMPGLTRDAWVIDRVNPWDARIPLYVQAGSFTLPLPIDPETFRDTYQSYAVFNQAVGDNAFIFFDPKIGGRLGIGNPLAGISVQLFAGPGHDRQSGLPTFGTDFMGYVQHAMGPITLSAYRYEGTRPLVDGDLDRFQRTGYSIVYNDFRRWEVDTLLQTGWDSNCNVIGSQGCADSGGLAQLRYMFNNRLYILGRYEGTNDLSGGFTRDAVFLLGYGLTENSRITIEDVIAHVPQTTHTMNLQFTIAY